MNWNIRETLHKVYIVTIYTYIRVISARDMNQRETRKYAEKIKKIPAFKTEDEEREFWTSHDSTEYIPWDEAEKAIFPKLKPSTRTISLRLPEFMLDELRVIANKRDIPYQTLIKIFLKESLVQELR